jgi:hypothetical protein
LRSQRKTSSSPAFEITEEDLLAPDDELSAIFDYVLGQSNKLFTSNITSTKGAGIREPGCTLVEMVDLQLAPAPVEYFQPKIRRTNSRRYLLF